MQEKVKVPLIEYILVTPKAQTRIFDLQFQAEQYQVFHRDWRTQAIHYLTLTPIVWGLFVFLSPVKLPFPALSTSLPWAFDINNMAFILMWVLFLWYLRMNIAVGVATLPVLIILWITANVFFNSLDDRAVGYALDFFIVCGALQTFSHVFEEIPPPWSGKNTWVSFGIWKRVTPFKIQLAIFALFFSVFILIELISSPRLLPVQVLNFMFALGYKPEFLKTVLARKDKILEDYKNY